MRARDRVRMQLAVLDHGMRRTGEVLPIVMIVTVLMIGGPIAVSEALRWAWAVLRGLL